MRIPARNWRKIFCHRTLNDAEARAIEQNQKRAGNLAQPNASFSVLARGSAGRKKLNRDIPPIYMNGWTEGVSIQSIMESRDLSEGNKPSPSESRKATELGSALPIRYGSVIKLIHEVTGNSLHSHNRNYEHIGTSKQQQVTANFKPDDGDYWIVKGPHASPGMYRNGELVRNDDVIRLEHKVTRTNLHSHLHPSPVTSQQEITAFGIDGKGDENDNWKVNIQGGGDWLEGFAVRLIHSNTGVALHSHAGVLLPVWGLNQQEVTGYSVRDQNDLWKAMIIQEASVR